MAARNVDVAEVVLSTDGGQARAEAEFLDPVRRHAWRRWKFDWLTPKEPGQYTLLARAKDAGGVLQPDEHDQSYGTSVINLAGTRCRPPARTLFPDCLEDWIVEDNPVRVIDVFVDELDLGGRALS